MIGEVLLAVTYLGIGCAAIGVLWFVIGTLRIAFGQSEDHRKAKWYARPIDFGKHMGMR